MRIGTNEKILAARAKCPNPFDYPYNTIVIPEPVQEQVFFFPYRWEVVNDAPIVKHTFRKATVGKPGRVYSAWISEADGHVYF